MNHKRDGEMTGKTIRMENWGVVASVNNPYAPSWAQSRSLYGQVYNHPGFEDGEYVTTSSVVGKTKEDEVVTLSGSIYQLGQINPDYEQEFPDAKTLMLDCLKIKAQD